jgi:hypothetical protein
MPIKRAKRTVGATETPGETVSLTSEELLAREELLNLQTEFRFSAILELHGSRAAEC